MSPGLRPCLLVITIATWGCGGREPQPVPDAGETAFVADQGSFTGFTAWQSFDGGAAADDTLDGGQRTLYLNRAPPRGSLVFPVGTIIVKTTEGAQTFAMVKRGGGFNPQLDGWEWFELSPGTGNTYEIVWRGVGPSGTFVYANMPPTGCNDCHLLSYRNDFVAGNALQLSGF
jgi:hypothetical protein